MIKNPLVSVLITAYNSSEFLETTLDSLLNQTYQNLEIIIVEDGSQDSTPEIIERYAKNYVQVKAFFPGRLGRAKALNFGLARCNGMYVAINDADDYSKHDRILLQVQYLLSHPEIGLLGTGKEVIESGKTILTPTITEDALIRKAFLDGQPIQHSSVMFQKHVLDQVKGYNESIAFLLDRDIFIRVAKITKLAQLDEVLITLNRSSSQYFLNKYKGPKRKWMSTKYQLIAVFAFDFPKRFCIQIILKFIYSLVNQYKK